MIHYYGKKWEYQFSQKNYENYNIVIIIIEYKKYGDNLFYRDVYFYSVYFNHFLVLTSCIMGLLLL